MEERAKDYSVLSCDRTALLGNVTWNSLTGCKGAKSRWGQTTPQMGHEMSRFLVNF